MKFPLIPGARFPVKATMLLVLAFCQPTFAATTNRPPTIAGTPPATAKVGVTYTFQPVAADPEGQPLVYGISNLPSWAQFSTSTGRLSGTPGIAGTHENIRITVRDSGLMVGLPIFTIVVASASTVNRPPVISGSPGTSVTVGQAYSFTPTASDPDGNALTFSITNRPAWATFNSTTGRLSGTPTVAGTSSNISIRVSDGALTATLASFSITATTVANRPPVIGGRPVTTGVIRQPYSFRPTASDADGDRLTFTVVNRPAWATFDAATGTLYGTPTTSGNFANIGISVSDGRASASLPAFAIAVTANPTTSVTLSWRAPTTNTDGTPLTGLTGFRVFAGTAPGQYSQIVSVPNPGVTSAVLAGLATGNRWYFVVTALSTGGFESRQSQEVSVSL